MSANIQELAHRFSAIESAQGAMQEEMLEIRIMAENMKKSGSKSGERVRPMLGASEAKQIQIVTNNTNATPLSMTGGGSTGRQAEIGKMVNTGFDNLEFD